MIDLKINLINPENHPAPDESDAKKRKTWIIISLILLAACFVFIPRLLANQFNPLTTSKIWRGLQSLGLTGDRPLKGEENNRVNVLLLGMGGEGHDGAFLTDTIILASLRPTDGKAAFLSIPRDLVVNIPGYGWRRVNNANAFAESLKPGSGGQAAAQAVSQAFAVPIDYYIRLDFDGFKKIIDEVGGVRVHVDKSFYDNEYPTDDFKIQTISFQQGWQTMDGETALKFARSRHGSNGENSDFARSHRQEKIISALKDKIFSFETLIRPSRVQRIVQDLSQHLNTNLQIWEALRLAQMARRLGQTALNMKVLDDGPQGLLINTMIEGAFLLEPKNNNWQPLRDVAANLLNDEPKPASQEKIKISANIEIQNGTFLAGLANSTAEKLKSYGAQITATGNAPKRDFQKTAIYDLTNGRKKDILEQLQKILQADVNPWPTDWPPLAPENKSDFLVVVGVEEANRQNKGM